MGRRFEPQSDHHALQREIEDWFAQTVHQPRHLK
jgi:hypothetical protein